MKKSKNVFYYLFHNFIVRYLIVEYFRFRWKSISKIRLKQNYGRIARGHKPKIIFGTNPLKNNKYWSEALTDFDSTTISSTFFEKINKRSDFDLFYEDIIERNYERLPDFLKKACLHYLIVDFFLRNADVIVTSFESLNIDLPFDFYQLFKNAGIKFVVIPYGSDFWRYSQVEDESYKFGLMCHYPNEGIRENVIKNSINYWNEKADLVCLSSSIDGVSRYDIFPVNILCLDLIDWKTKKIYSKADGINGEVIIVHTPNHRSIKGTEFLIHAIEELRSEGFKIRLMLLEGIQNDEVKNILIEKADILVEKLTYSVYGLSGIEGMAIGLPVISNLENEKMTRAFRRYSYLDECPLLSSNPETIKRDLRALIINPTLRSELGLAGRKYAIKYHSYNAFQEIFKKMIDKIWFNKDVDLMNMFHPLNPDSYNNKSPKIEHPLIENNLPGEYFSQQQELTNTK